MKLKQIFSALVLIVLTFSIIFENKLPLIKYFDEVLTLLFFVVSFVILLFKKVKIPKEEGFIFLVWFILVFIGIISNVYSNVDRKLFDIVLDIISFSKFFVFVLCTRYLFTYEMVDKIFSSSVKVCKVLTIGMAVLGFASLFIDFGMRGQKRFGIYGFNFIFQYAHEFTVFVLCIYTILLLKLKKKNQRIFYSILIFIVLALTLKGPSLLVPCIYLGVITMVKAKNQLKAFSVLIVLLFVGFLISRYQFVTYLTNENAPRYILFKYGFITAHTYFPFGSGFGTYGSSVAASSYSPLYELYNFTSLYGMNPKDYQFLNDTYYPMIIAQFGFLGAILMAGVFIFCLKKSFSCHSKICKIASITLLCYFVIHSIGSSILTSSSGVLGLVFLAFVWIYDRGRAQNEIQN